MRQWLLLLLLLLVQLLDFAVARKYFDVLSAFQKFLILSAFFLSVRLVFFLAAVAAAVVAVATGCGVFWETGTL